MGYESLIEQNKEWISDIWERLDKKLRRISVKSKDKIPYTTVDGVHSNTTRDKIGKEGITWWTILWRYDVAYVRGNR